MAGPGEHKPPSPLLPRVLPPLPTTSHRRPRHGRCRHPPIITVRAAGAPCHQARRRSPTVSRLLALFRPLSFSLRRGHASFNLFIHTELVRCKI
jgi:hypothetical protein